MNTRWTTAASAAVFAAIAIVAGWDAVGHLRNGLPLSDVAVDLTLTGATVLGGGFVLRRFLGVSRHARQLLDDLGAARGDAEAWRRRCAEVLPALGDAIFRQLDRWSLTPDEKEVALLLLEGLSTDEIAERLHSTPEAARARAAHVFQKARVSGPAGLSAFFLRDLLFVTNHRAAAERGDEAARAP